MNLKESTHRIRNKCFSDLSGLLSKSTALFKINHTIQQRLKRQRDIETKTTLNHEQLIEKLAQGKIDADTFREQSQSFRQQSNPITSINAHQIRKVFKISYNNVSR